MKNIKICVFLSLVFNVVTVQGEDAGDDGGLDSNRLYNESIQILGVGRAPVVRWHDNIRLAMVGEIQKETVDTIQSLFREISLFTGVRFRVINHLVENAEQYADLLNRSPPYDLGLCDQGNPTICANFVVVLSDRSSMHNVAMALPLRPVFQRATSLSSSERNTVSDVVNDEEAGGTSSAATNSVLCFFSPGIYRNTRIVRSVVYVQNSLSLAMKRTCLQEEIYQSFGLFGDVTESGYFSFNNRVAIKKITTYDKRLLTSLYDGEFGPGTPAHVVARQLHDYCYWGCE